MGKQGIPPVRLDHPERAGTIHPTRVIVYHSLLWFALFVFVALYFGQGGLRIFADYAADMIGWKQSTALSTLTLGAAGQSIRVHNLSEVAWTVSNDALNISIPGSLPSHVRESNHRG